MKIYPQLPKYSKIPAIFFKMSKNEMDAVQKEVDKVHCKIDEVGSTDLTSGNHRLIGHINHQYFFGEQTTNIIEEMMRPALTEVATKHGNFSFMNFDPVRIMSCWVNFQKKYEYNPVHAHVGIFSFVIWVKIPYLSSDEDKQENVKKRLDYRRENLNSEENSNNGTFQFLTKSELVIETTTLMVDKTWEGRGVIFPSSLFHCVYPFYSSDDFRISISGNYGIT